MGTRRPSVDGQCSNHEGRVPLAIRSGPGRRLDNVGLERTISWAELVADTPQSRLETANVAGACSMLVEG